LTWQRPYLYVNRARNVFGFLRGALLISSADGGVASLINASIYWLSIAGGAAIAGWYGTMIRLLQALFNPIIFLVIPLSSFLAIKWPSLTPVRRDVVMTWVKVGALVYGGIIAVAVTVGGRLYMIKVMHFHENVRILEYLALASIVFGMTSQRCYSIFNYAVLQSRALSAGTIGVTLFALTTYMTIGRILAPLEGIDLMYFALGVPLIGLIFVHDWHRRRAGQRM
jgi:hypothetical protein